MPEITLDHDQQFEFPDLILIEHITIKHTGPYHTIKIFDSDNFLKDEYMCSLDLAYDNADHTVHESLLRKWQGKYRIEGLTPGDSVRITYRLATPKPEPLRLSERELAREQEKYSREHRRGINPQHFNEYGNLVDRGN